jgi:hypothetical protein
MMASDAQPAYGDRLKIQEPDEESDDKWAKSLHFIVENYPFLLDKEDT